MPLPKIATPTYELELPSSGQTIKYRPFLVKEEKLLVIALESEDTKQITNAIKAVIRACIMTKGVKVETLPTFDIEFLFLNIRGKSVGEDIEVKLICPDDKKTEVPVTINLDEIKPSFEESVGEENNNSNNTKDLKAKKKFNNNIKSPHAIWIGLDKITAKSSELRVNFNEVKNNDTVIEAYLGKGINKN